MSSPAGLTLVHLSEDPSIELFTRRAALATPDAGPVVWGIDARHAPNYLLPRDAPRVCFRASADTTDEDVRRFLAGDRSLHVVAIEAAWLGRLRGTTLYRYHLPPETFRLADRPAGYYVSVVPVRPLRVERIDDLLAAIAEAGVELQITPCLWPLFDAVAASTLEFSMIRMRNAAPRAVSEVFPG